MAPAYDLICTAVYPNVQKRLAMKIGGAYDPEKIFLRHWHRLVADTAVARKAMDRELQELGGVILEKAASLIKELKAQNADAPIYADIYKIIERRARQISGKL